MIVYSASEAFCALAVNRLQRVTNSSTIVPEISNGCLQDKQRPTVERARVELALAPRKRKHPRRRAAFTPPAPSAAYFYYNVHENPAYRRSD